MSVAIPLAESTRKSIIPVRWPALAGGFRHCLTWLEKVDARGAESALALLYRALALGGL